MRLHVQKISRTWTVVNKGPCHFSTKSKLPLFEQFRMILAQEKSERSKKRASFALLFITLDPKEEDMMMMKIRALHEMVRGKLADEQIKKILADMVRDANLDIELINYVPGSGLKKKGRQPLFAFCAQEEL